MKLFTAFFGGATIWVAGAVLATTAPDNSPRPETRPEAQVAMAAVSPASAMLSPIPAGVRAGPAVAKAPLQDLPDLRPALRPVSPQKVALAARPSTPFLGPETSPRPTFRPDSVVQKALFGKRKKRKGSVCGDIDIQGDVVGNYGKGGGCYIPNAVRVKSVSGVRLSQTSLMTCKTADSLKKWIDKGLQPAFKKQGPVVELKVAAHYACRTRNNKKGAKLSEHAKGKAIDISGFVMHDGDVVTVLKDWGKGRDGKSLAKAHKTACGPFGTVLGPKSDRYHRDHFHFDVASYRSGAYCR